MAIVRPFRGLRPKPELASRVACPPYDVLSADEARQMARREPYSFLRVNKPELEFEESADPYSAEVYRRGKENLTRLISDGIMKRDDTDCLYLYRLTMNGQSQTGLVALTSVAEYLSGVIKKHEHTRPEKVKDRADHIVALGAQVGPVLSAFRHTSAISNLMAEETTNNPAVDFLADDSVRHQLWVIEDAKRIESLVAAFDRLDALYIADGHHRSEAAAEVLRRQQVGATSDNRGYFLSVLFDDRELTILPYNRVVRDFSGLSLKEVIEKATVAFKISPADKAVEPDSRHQFGMYCEGGWYHMTARSGSFDADHPTESIDTAILFSNLMAPVLGIEDARTDSRIGFVGGIRGNQELMRLVDSKVYRAAFSLFPTSVEQLLTVADAGKVMPPKSTWFEPKLRTGMVVNMLGDL